MSVISKFHLRDVRCFAGEHEFNIRPLTFLVGENSTGKSTVLACMQALHEYTRVWERGINFNTPPYDMGAFPEIVRKSSAKITDMELGFEYNSKDGKKKAESRLILCKDQEEFDPIAKEFKWIFDEGQVIIRKGEGKRGVRYGNVKPIKGDVLIMETSEQGLSYMMPIDIDITSSIFDFKGKEKEKSFLSSIIEKNEKILTESWMLKMHSISPIRSEPKRTYDTMTEVETPSGSGMPRYLRDLSTDKETWQEFKNSMKKFGEESGLFSDIKVRNFGIGKGNPFQIQVKIRGGAMVNLMDVGYGVSQVLPILVRILTERYGNFLMQQPEVHLHPKAQAALTTALIDRIRYANARKLFVIETHSDYMINRARIEIMRGNIKPEDVSLIYLEPASGRGSRVKVHNIRFIDKEANMEGVPKNYREFFMKEGDRLLGFRD